MKIFLAVILTIIFFQSQAISNPLGFVSFIPFAQQTTTLTGGESVEITAGGKTELKGAVIDLSPKRCAICKFGK